MIDKRYIDKFISENNQYPKQVDDSNLWKSIQQAWGETAGEAQRLARYHCNSLSFYTLCRARGFIEFHYTTWLEILLKNGDMSKKGYLGDKLQIAELFGFEDQFGKLEYDYNYNNILDAKSLDEKYGYNIKVYANTGSGEHFMPSYVECGKLFVSDPGNRGIHKEAKKVIPAAKFQWLLKV